jgi:hypothetical protein
MDFKFSEVDAEILWRMNRDKLMPPGSRAWNEFPMKTAFMAGVRASLCLTAVFWQEYPDGDTVMWKMRRVFESWNSGTFRRDAEAAVADLHRETAQPGTFI